MRLRPWAVAVVASGCLSRPTPLTVDAPVDATPPPNYAFVTSMQFDLSSLGGVSAADTVCNTLAHSSPLLHGDTFVAWLSTSSQDAIGRLAGARGWIGTDGSPFVDQVADLQAGKILFPLHYDENGNDVGRDQLVGTGTQTDGSDFSGNDCDGVAGPGNSSLGYGLVGAGTDAWTESYQVACAQPVHLYCFGTDRAATVSPPARTGPIAFVSQPFLSAGFTVTGADMECAKEAEVTGLGTNFVSVLATSSASIAMKLGTPVASPWVRPDGVPTTRDFVSFAAPIDQDVTGAYLDADVWTGATDAESAAATTTDCVDWTDSSVNSGLEGEVARTTGAALDATSNSCSARRGVFCVQMP